jgi:hypothetical protein
MTSSSSAVSTAPSRTAVFKSQMAKVWRLSTPYFQSEDKWKARAMLAAIVALNLAGVYLLVLYNDWYRLFYDALENKNQPVFWTQLGRFTYIAFAMIILAVYKFYLTQLLEIRWRAWMTGHYLERWLANRSYYHLELARFAEPAAGATAAVPDNPDQRIQEDLNLFTTYTISLSMGLLNAVVTLVTFVGILWGLSGEFAFHFNGSEYVIPGHGRPAHQFRRQHPSARSGTGVLRRCAYGLGRHSGNQRTAAGPARRRGAARRPESKGRPWRQRAGQGPVRQRQVDAVSRLRRHLAVCQGPGGTAREQHVHSAVAVFPRSFWHRPGRQAAPWCRSPTGLRWRNSTRHVGSWKNRERPRRRGSGWPKYRLAKFRWSS